MSATKAIIAVAGYGTRRLPITKSIEKCMLPLLNRPIIDYIVEDLVKAGVTDIYFVVSGDARQLRDYYERDVALEDYLLAKGKGDLVAEIQPPQGVRFHYVEQDRQDSRYGTSIPVWLCRDHISPEESVWVIMGDQCLWHEDGKSEMQLLADMVKEQEVDGGLIGVEVPDDQIEHYGIIDMDEYGHFRTIVEKPKREDAPSNLNNASIYLLPGYFMEYLERQAAKQQDSEYYITDPINELVTHGKKLIVRRSDAAYLDCGTVNGWVAANAYLLDKLA
jgi:UTP--glucose-1-phosphate uridylyltransferase